MKAKKILFITTEMVPFVPENFCSLRGKTLPQSIQDLGHEIRTFSPDWGIINERRNQLHEVIRLSGMNLIIDDTDHPLIIKVASLPSARMQIYFIDNDDFFTRKGIKADEDGNEYTDNGERAIFYARGVLETVKKLRWTPDVIHCHGWASAIAPILIKKAYCDEPSFAETKVVFSTTADELTGDMGERFVRSIPFRDITTSDVEDICTDKCDYTGLAKIAVKFSDGLILEDSKVSKDIIEYAQSLGKPVLKAQKEEDYAKAYSEFYETLIED